MRLRKPCSHDRYDEHRHWDTDGSVQYCPGGEFLPDATELEERISVAIDPFLEWSNPRLVRAVLNLLYGDAFTGDGESE